MQIKSYFSLFSGIGGFELGIERAQGVKQNNHTQGNAISCVGFSEIDKYAIQIYQRHFPGHQNFGDITAINEQSLPGFDLLVGGFPCQAFSVAGKRCGFNDTRGTLFFEIARIVRKKQPRLLLLENVKGLLSHDNGRTFHIIITALDELGYDLQWQVLNSKNFGVPQNRRAIAYGIFGVVFCCKRDSLGRQFLKEKLPCLDWKMFLPGCLIPVLIIPLTGWGTSL